MTALTKQTIIADLKASIEELERILYTEGCTLSNTGWVIVAYGTPSMPLRFDISPEGKVTNPRVTDFKHASSFSQENAKHVANTVKNGDGETAIAIPRVRAIMDQLESKKEVLNMILSRG